MLLRNIYTEKNSFLTLFALGVFPSLGLPCLGGRGIQKNCWGGGREDLTEPHFKNKNTKNLKKKKKKEKICDWLVDKYQCVLAHVTAQACSFWYVCARVFMCIRVHPSLCLCVCMPVSSSLTPISQKAALLTVHRLAGRPSAFYFYYCFLTKNTQARGATAARAAPLGCTKMNRVLFNDESREFLYICKLA